MKQKITKDKGLSFASCIMIAIGGMMGSSIFTLSGVTYSMAGTASILSWVLAGIVLLLYSLNIAELATRFPSSGGIFVFPNKILGRTQKQRTFFGWLAAWSWLNVSILGTSFSAICVTNYIMEIVPIVKEYVFLQILIPVMWILICFIFNTIGTSFLGKVNNVLTITLLFVCGLYVLKGFTHINVENYMPFYGGAMGMKGVVSSIPIAMLAYGSIIAIASISGEIRETNKIQKIMFTSVFVTVIVYCLILLVTFGMAPSKDFVEDPSRQYSILSYALLQGLNGKTSFILKLIPIGAMLAITTTMLVLIMDSARTVMAASNGGFLPKYFGKINKKTGTPIRALVLVSVVSLLITLKPDLIWLMINTGSICCALTVIIITITLIYLRKHPNDFPESNTFKVPFGILFPIITLVVIAVTLALLYFGDGGHLSFKMTVIWYLIGLVIYMIRTKLIKSKSEE